MKRIALCAAILGFVAFGTRQVSADESAPLPVKNAVVSSAESQAVITPVHRYVARYGPGWSSYYVGPRYHYSTYPRHYAAPYHTYYPWHGYYGYYGRPGYYYSGPRVYFGWGF